MFGLPFRSMAYFERSSHTGGWHAKVEPTKIIAAFGYGRPPYQPIPLAPILLGFIANTLVYAALMYLLFIAPWALRRWSRRRREVCVRCAYPVGVSAVCTECGAAVVARK